MKKVNFILTALLALTVFSCSIDRKENLVYGLDGKDGEQGIQGIAGQDGKDGLSSAISISLSPEGTTVFFGLDVNGDGVLQTSENQLSTFIRNGEDGAQGVQGEQGIMGLMGDQGIPGLNGLDGEPGADGDVGATGSQGVAGQDGKDAFQIVSRKRTSTLADGRKRTIIFFYQDIDGNGEANPSTDRLINRFFLDEGEKGEKGETGATGEQGNAGQDGADGEDGETPTIVVDYISDADGTTVSITVNDEDPIEFYVANGTDGEDGEDGFNSLLRTLRESRTIDGTTFQGISVFTGLDTNRNGFLDQSEISQTSFVFDGINGETGETGATGANGNDGENGLNTLVRIERNNDTGVTVVYYGVDENRNGVLETSEEDGSYEINDGTDGQDGSNGADGQDGEDGTDGTNGTNGQDGNDGACSFVVVLDEPAGENCEFGGIVIITGKDKNGNKVFDENTETLSTTYVCESSPCITNVLVDETIDFEEFNNEYVSVSKGINISTDQSGFERLRVEDEKYDNTHFGAGGNNAMWITIADNDRRFKGTGGKIEFNFDEPTFFESVDILDIDCSSCYGDGSRYYVEITYSDGGTVRKGLPFRPSNVHTKDTVEFNENLVVKVVVSVNESYAIDNFRFKKEVTRECKQ